MQQNGCRLVVERKRLRVATRREEEHMAKSREAAVVEVDCFAPGRRLGMGTFGGSGRWIWPAGLSRDPP